MVDKIQTKVIDADSAPVKGAISNSDYVMIQNDSTKEIEKVLVSDLLAGSAGAIRIKGEAQMDNASTTPTSIVVTGDPDDPTINQGVAPTDPAPNGAAYVVVTNNLNGVSTQITGETRTVFDSDQIVWTGSSWGIVEIGTRVQSVNGRVGNVTGLAEANNVYSKTEADNKFYSATNKPTPADIGTLTTSEIDDKYLPRRREALVNPDTLFGDGEIHVSELSNSYPELGGVRALLTLPAGNGGFQLAARTVGDEINYRICDVNTGAIGPWRRLYTTGYKPTSGDVGAVSKTGDTMTGTLVLDNVGVSPRLSAPPINAVDGKLGLTLAITGQSPSNGYLAYSSVVNFNCSNTQGDYTRQFQMQVTNDGKTIQMRASHVNAPDDTKWYPWYSLYTTGNKPTPAEIGALGATDTAVNSSKLEGSTKAQVIADARSGLALAGTSYSKGESDSRYKPIGYAPAWTEITGVPEFATRWPTKAEVGLSNVNNWGASSATNSTSTTTYATTAGVKAAYDAAQAARSAPDLAADRKRKITVSSSAPSGGSDGDIWLQYV